MFAYAKVLDVEQFGVLSIGLLISASLGMVNAFGLYLLMQRDMPRLFAAGRVTRGMVLMGKVSLVTIASAIPLIALSWTGVSLAGGAGMLLALATLHGLSNQLFGVISTESKSRLRQVEFAVTLFGRSCLVSIAGFCAALMWDSAEAVLAAELGLTAVVVAIASVQAAARFRQKFRLLPMLAVRHLRRSEWRVASGLLVSVILAFLIQNIDRWLAVDALDKRVFAQFAFGWTLLSMASTFQATINANLFPGLAARIYHDGPGAVLAQTRRVSLGMFGILAACAVPGFYIIKWGIEAYYPQYIEVISYIPLFLAAAALRASDFWSNYLIISRKTRLLFISQGAVLFGAIFLWFIATRYTASLSMLFKLSLLTFMLSCLSFVFGFAALRIGGAK
ncbi:lipopolysaccharide biosynthesis protein [Cupriavidus sp. M-11]